LANSARSRQDLGVSGNLSTVFGVVVLVTALATALFAVGRLRARRGIATATQRATYEVLHTAGLAAEPLRAGLSAAGAAKAVRHLRTLVGAAGLALLDRDELLALDGRGPPRGAAARGGGRAVRPAGRRCWRASCSATGWTAGTGAVVAPLTGRRAVVGRRRSPTVHRHRLAGHPGDGALGGNQLAPAELDSSGAAGRAGGALRAQISRTSSHSADRDRLVVRHRPGAARELILEFAEFTRYSFRAHGEFTTLAEELRSIDRYLLLERARFGDRLQVRLQIAPEVLPVTLPFLCLQPLVENAVRHGLSRKPGTGMVCIEARDAGAECHITVEDDGVGMDPATLTAGIAELAGASGDPADDPGQHGASNVDERLRSAFGTGSVVRPASDRVRR
jgi:two-component system LytT family sensor kinase